LSGKIGEARLFCKDKNGKTVLVLDNTFRPYFYVMPKGNKTTGLEKKIKKLDTKKIEANILNVESVVKSFEGKKRKLIKVTIDNPRRIPDVRDLIKHWKEVDDTYEYSISFSRRYLIDKQIEPMNWIEVDGRETKSDEYKVDRVLYAKTVRPSKLEKPLNFKILAFDTEWIDENGKSKLIMLSLVSNDGLKKVLTTYNMGKLGYVENVKEERKIIERFLKIVEEKNPDFICSYNGDNFDFPKLKDLTGEFKIPLKLGRDNSPIYVVRRGRISSAKMRGRIHIDLFDFIDHILSPSMRSEVMTLDEVSQELIGEGKKKMKYKEMVELWSKKNGVEKIAEYCLQDSELTLKLAGHILPQIFAISKLTGLLPFDSCRNTYSQLVEAFLMKNTFADGVLIPNQPKYDEIEERRLQPAYKGAIVIEPKKGIHSNILVFDFRSLYPTIIYTHNISPETFNCKEKECEKNKVPDTNWCFCTKKKGFIPVHVKELIEDRKAVKEQMKKLKKDSEEYKKLDNEQYALKIISNAMYGMFGFFGSRWYCRECGAASAAFGRYYINKIIDLAKNDGFEIVYGDTDSLMAKLPGKLSLKDLKKRGENFVETVNKKLPGIIELEFRDLYEGGIFVSRKEGEIGAKKRYALIDYQGNLEIRGFETVRRDWCNLSKVIQREVLTITLREKNPKKALKLVSDTVKRIKDGKVSLDDLVIYEQITRPLSEYEQIGPHVKAAQKLIEKGMPVMEGMIMGFVIVMGSGSISDRAVPVEFVKPNQYDPEYYIHNQIIPASMRILKALGYTEEDVLSGKVQRKLEGFLKK
jgi:DNA polymerase elongation subunit (family B)